MRKTLTVTAMVVALALSTMATAFADVERYQSTEYTIDVASANNDVRYAHEVTLAYNPCDDTWDVSSTEFGVPRVGEYLGGAEVTDEGYTGRYRVGGETFVLTLPLNDEDEFGEPDTNSDNVHLESVEGEWSKTRTDYKNHGQYVSENGGGPDAAHSCIGKPIVSNSN